MRLWVLFFHVLSAVVWLGGSIYVEALIAGARREGDDKPRVVRRAGATNRRVLNAAGIATVVFGFWLVFVSPGWEFEMLWVTVGIVLAAVALLIDLFYATPRSTRLKRERGGDEADGAAIVAQLVMSNHVRTGLLFAALVFMVFKP